MRAEHEEIREWRAALDEKVREDDTDSDREAKMLVVAAMSAIRAGLPD